MNTIKTFRTKLTLGQIDFTIETSCLDPRSGKAKLQLLEKIIRNGTQKEILFTDPKEVVFTESKEV